MIRRHTVERTKKAQLRPGKLSEKTESCRDNVWNEIELKGPLRLKQTQEQNFLKFKKKKKKMGKAGLVYV